MIEKNFDQIEFMIIMISALLVISSGIYLVFCGLSERNIKKWVIPIFISGFGPMISIIYTPLYLLSPLMFLLLIIVILIKKVSTINLIICSFVFVLIIPLTFIIIQIIRIDNKYYKQNKEAYAQILSKSGKYNLMDSIIYEGNKAKCEKLANDLLDNEKLIYDTSLLTRHLNISKYFVSLLYGKNRFQKIIGYCAQRDAQNCHTHDRSWQKTKRCCSIAWM